MNTSTSAQSTPDYSLRVIVGPQAGRTFQIVLGDMIIGRSDGSQIRLDGTSVNWQHALLRRDKSGVSLRQIGSFGLDVNDKRINIDDSHKLRPGDVIRIAPDIVLRLEVASDTARSSRLTFLVGIAIVAIGAVACLLVVGQGQQGADLGRAQLLQVVQKICDATDADKTLLPQPLAKALQGAVNADYVRAPASKVITDWNEVLVILDRLPTTSVRRASDTMFVETALLRQIEASREALPKLDKNRLFSVIRTVARRRLADLSQIDSSP